MHMWQCERGIRRRWNRHGRWAIRGKHADKFSNPKWIAADLIAQAEHDIFSQSILISDSKDLIKLVNKNIIEQLINIPKRKIALQSLKNYGLVLCKK